ncbi:MAG TPA: LEA type 2 family protein [Steroidobacteraceae bacterium]|jgi:LEA14-like dessication related protein|nr:LEA type 2 family protein [Steroidobacteraceae bacterium]
MNMLRYPRALGRHRLLSGLAVAALLAAGVAAWLGGCATLVPKLEPPRLLVTGVRLRHGNLQHQQLQLALHVINPNDRAIAVRGLTINLDLAGTPFASGQSDAAFTLPALGQTDFTLDVTANVASALLIVAANMSHRTLDYRVYGEVHLQKGLVRNLHFNQTGRVRL